MTIISAALAQDSGSLRGEGDLAGIERSYTLKYVVKTDSATHSPIEIERYFKTNNDINGNRLPYYGRTFRFPYGNSSDVESLCVGLDADYRRGSEGFWDVTANFKPDPKHDKEKRETVDGDESDDPEEWVEKIETSSTQITRPAEMGVFIGFDPPGIRNRFLVPGRTYPIVNSAIAPLVPAPDDIVEIEVIRLGKYVNKMDADLPFRGVLNNDNFTINKRPDYEFKRDFLPFQVWVKRIDGVCETINGAPWVYREIELWVHPDNWFEHLLDRGIHRRAAEGDRKPGGAANEVYTYAESHKAGRPINTVMTDDQGNPITQPQLLDGNGQPIQNPLSSPPVWMIWKLKKDKALAGFPW